MDKNTVSLMAFKTILTIFGLSDFSFYGDAILTGHNELELPDYRKRPNNTRRVDPKHLILAHLKKRGYRTSYFEDSGPINTFNYRYNGLADPPSDHYGRVLFLHKDLVKDSAEWFTPEYCLGSQWIVRFMLNHADKFFKLSGKKFGFMFSVAHTHSDDNSIAWVDDDLASFLKKFQNYGYLNDTLLFVMGDHGQRLTFITRTYQGKIEERLPFVSIILPESLRKSRPEAYENLVANSKVLTTPYDIHSTILDALGLRHLKNRYKVPGADVERGLSLLDAIPPNRSCAEAGIMPHWCACAKWKNVSSADPIYKEVAMELADYINEKIEPIRKYCAKRELVSILWVNLKSFKRDILGFEAQDDLAVYMGKYNKASHVTTNLQYFQTKIVMSPGEAEFEGSVQFDTQKHIFKVSDGDVSRVNRYGDEPNCIKKTYPNLCPYCYCLKDNSK